MKTNHENGANMDTKTEEKHAEVLQLRTETTALAAREPTVWDVATIELIKKQVCPQGIPDGEFALFIEKCKASGMNPLLGEAFCVPRNTNVGTRDAPRWVTLFAFQPAEAGMESRADRFPDFRGLRAAAVYEKDSIEIDAEAGTVSHKYSPVGDRGALVGAWAICYREGRKTPVEFCKLAEYAQNNATWGGKKETMIVKCARAAALRRGYPNAFSGIYVREEVEEEPQALPATTTPRPTPASATKALAEKLGAKSQATGGAAVPETKVCQYGPAKGTPISALGPAELTGSISYLEGRLTNGRAKLAKGPDPKVAQGIVELEAELVALKVEQQLRLDAVDSEVA